MKFSIQEQIAAYEARRATASARMVEIMEASAEAGATLDTAQQEEFDGLQADIEAVENHIKRLKSIEVQMVRSASPIIVTDQASAAAVRAPVGAMTTADARPVTMQRNLPKGLAFTRYAIALARSRGNLMQALEVSRGWRDTTPEVETVLRAAVAAGTTTDPAWAAPLVEYQNMTGEFIELLRPATIIGRINGFRRVPFNIQMPAQKTSSTAQWVGEGKPKPVSALSFETMRLGFAKVAGIVVLTDELVRFSNPSAEGIVQRDLVETITQLLDHDFVDPAKAEVPDVSPESITHQATYIDASGDTADALRWDVRSLFSAFTANNASVAGAYWIMDPVIALTIGMMVNPLGQAEFPGIDQNGGVLYGLPVICSTNIPKDANDLYYIILVKPSEVLMADDGGVTLDASREASLQMDSAPVAGASQLLSLWQNNMIALRAERFINWKARRALACAYIRGANYGAPEAPDTGGGA
ncbi:phage major capsid protein [Caballeronia zhejiangensis]|uniref:phage major capsid protein n=1 Tax=Caballeronia zhejiangensis TaxID=871203 RepID=UPI00158CD0CE|nr:phage major capsid protein [Caballeronia zhejiangensis]MCG7403020.1 phage major capsid protein [Caballeronia zhejiangensis]MCI1043844.1 phage major capsid protein [Caballeronia zhejiangensis]